MNLLDAKQQKMGADPSPGDGYNDATDTAEPAAESPDDMPAEEPAEEPAGEAASPELIQQMQAALREKVPQQQQAGFDRLMVAAQKALYSDQMKPMVQQALQAADGDVDQRIATNAVGLLLILDKESKGTLPQELLAPGAAGIALEIADFVMATGRPVSKQDLADALPATVGLLMQKAGANEQQIQQALGGQQEQPQQAQPMQPPGAMA